MFPHGSHGAPSLVAWKKGALRFDLQAAQLKRTQEKLRKGGIVSSGKVECPMKYVVDFFEKYISEWNPNKDQQGVEEECHVDATPGACVEAAELTAEEAGGLWEYWDDHGRAQVPSFLLWSEGVPSGWGISPPALDHE